MRLFSFSVLLGAAALLVSGAPDGDGNTQAPFKEEGTVFNQKKVPPLTEMGPNNWEKERTASKWLLAKYYSPWCHHCKAFAPIFQTLYEFYYTSTPGGSGNENANFTSFYDFKFGTIDCTAYYDLCTAHSIASYPTTILYKDGAPFTRMLGVKDLKTLSAGIEEALNSTKPGTRPLQLHLPEPGATSTPDNSPQSGASTTAKDSKESLATPDVPKDLSKPKTTDDESSLAAASPKQPKETGAAAKYAPKAYNPPANVLPKPAATPNIQGKSISLSAEGFQDKVISTQDPWFVKFYVPWCHHCQAMAPAWEQLAKHMQGKLNIGEVNCDAQSRLCKEVKVPGYPTALLFRGGERVEYQGLRGLGDLVQYAEQAISLMSGTPDVDAAALQEMEKEADVIFIYFYDHATTSEDFSALERLPLNLIGRAKLVKTRDPALYERYKITNWPRLIVSREGRPTHYNPLTPKEMRDVGQMLSWMKSVWLPMVPELSASNAREIMDGKIVVLGILNREDLDGFAGGIREMKTAASEWMDKQIQLFQLERQELRDTKQLRIEEAEDRGDQRALRAAKGIRVNMDKSNRKQVAFAWVDGVFWHRWIRTTYGVDIKDGERVIINDEDNRRYWDQTITGNPITPSRTSILETLNKVTSSPPKIKPKFTISSLEKVFFDMRMTSSEHPYLVMGCLLGIALGSISWFRGRSRRTRGHGYFRLDDNYSYKDCKGPLLGATNGKVD